MKRSSRFWLVFLLLLGMLPILAARPLQQAQAVITNPQSNATVRGLVVISGSANTGGFQFYKLEWGRGASPTDWHLIGSTRSTAVTDGVLAQWDTTSLPDGVYTLRLQVVKADGNYQEAYARQLVVSNKRPTETPTVVDTEPTAKPTAGPSATPGPTTTLTIRQPTAALAQPTASPTPVRPTRGSSLPTLPLGQWRDAFIMGAGAMAAIFAVLALVFALRRLL
jgi:hypothetical protein